MIRLEEALAIIESSSKHRVLKELPKFTSQITSGVETRRGFLLDVETTGLDTKTDEIIEFGGIPFRFTLDGTHVETEPPVHQYNEPRRAITEEITKLTGITMDMVAGHALDVPAIEAVLTRTDLVIAHNSEFDRPMVERYVPGSAGKFWGCSMTQVPWGTATRKLEYLLYTQGYFFEAHNAVGDCEAALFAITRPLGDGRTGLAHILDASRAKAYHVWAIDSPFESKDVLKQRGYRWNGGEDGRPKAWHKEITAVDAVSLTQFADAEEAWLRANPYRGTNKFPVRFDIVDGRHRFTKRG